MTIISIGQEFFRRNGVALIVNKRLQNAVLGCNLKNDRMILIHFQGKPSTPQYSKSIPQPLIAKKVKVNWIYADPQHFLELTPRKDVLYIIGDWKTKVGSQETAGITYKFGLGAGQNLTEFCQGNTLVITSIFFQQHKRCLYMDITKIKWIMFFVVKDGEALNSQQV